jgi:hypothetical protein
MPGAAEFCTREPHFEGEEVFGSQKRKADVPLGSEHESHRLDKVNFSHPRVRTRSSAAKEASCSLNIIPEELSPDLQDGQTTAPDAPIELVIPIDISRAPHVTAIQEIHCNEYQWHIARLRKTSKKACFAQQAVTKNKCIAKIVQDNKSTAAPTYTGMMFNSQKKKDELMEFFFCNDDIERCVKGSKRRWVKSKPDVPDIWPVKLSTNLTKKEILALENAGFHLPQCVVISPRRLFGGDIPIDVASYPTPSFPDDHPKTRSGKNIRRNKKAPTTKHANNSTSALTLKAHVRQITMILHPRYGCIITLDSGILPNIQQYMITIGTFPNCSCLYFKEMVTTALGKRGQWANCKHLYFIFTIIYRLDVEVDDFIHAPSFSFNEVKHVLENGILKR